MGLLTDLEVINYCLSALGEDPVLEIDETDSQIQAILDTRMQQSKQLQMKGYSFNTENGVSTAADSEGYVYLPDNCLVASASNKELMLVQRGNRMYSKKLHSYQINSSVLLDMIYFIEWDELPAHAQVLIQAKTAYKVYLDVVGSEFQAQKLAEAVAEANLAFQGAEDEVEKYTFLDPKTSLTAFNSLQRNGIPSTYRILY